ncbi:hypothetical protein BpHYR1_026613, partial [Brachionus plicatilis]
TDLQVPNEKQLYNYLAQYRKRKGNTRMNFNELYAWCTENIAIPTNENEPFLSSYQIKVDSEDTSIYPEDRDSIQIEELSFRLFLTSQRLLENCKNTKFIQADSTYKLIWNNFPSEHDYQFIFSSLLIGLQLTNQQELGYVDLVADAADAITNGFKNVFGVRKRGMCWFHPKKAITTRIAILNDSTLQSQIMLDLDALQLCQSDCLFEKASKLFLKKWINHSNKNIKDFLRYFESEWLLKHPGWYEGFLSDGPSTNNGLESINSTLKKNHSFRKRLPLHQFLSLAKDIIKHWSKRRDPLSVNCKNFSLQPTIDTQLLTKTYDWIKHKKKSIARDEDNMIINYTNSTMANVEVNNQNIKTYRSAVEHLNFKSFDKFYGILFKT